MERTDCLIDNDSEKVYYVTMRRDDGAYRFLSGPFDNHCHALADVTRCVNLAHKSGDPRAPWYYYGTASLPRTAKPPRVLFPA